MPLSEKALLAAYSADVYADNGETPTLAVWRKALTPALSAFQAALLEELREKVNGAPCASGSHPVAESSCLLRRDAVLALLSPPPPEPAYKPGDWVVHEDGGIGLFLGYSVGDARFGTFVLTSSNYARNGEWIHKLRPATDEEVRRARGEEQP